MHKLLKAPGAKTGSTGRNSMRISATAGGGVTSNAYEFVNMSRDFSGEGRDSVLYPPLSASGQPNNHS